MALRRFQMIAICLAGSGMALAPMASLAGGDIVDIGPIFVPDFAGKVSGSGVSGSGATGNAGSGAAAGAGAGQPAKTATTASSAASGAASDFSTDLFAGLAGGGQTASGPATDRVVAATDAAIGFCAAIAAEEYHIDCLSERFHAIAEGLPETGDYADIRTALETASRQLADVVTANRSYALPNATMRTTGPAPTRTTRPLRPVRPANLAAASAQATAIIAETETVLLRSATLSAARSRAYQRVSAVVGSAKVLLRSA